MSVVADKKGKRPVRIDVINEKPVGVLVPTGVSAPIIRDVTIWAVTEDEKEYGEMRRRAPRGDRRIRGISGHRNVAVACRESEKVGEYRAGGAEEGYSDCRQESSGRRE